MMSQQNGGLLAKQILENCLKIENADLSVLADFALAVLSTGFEIKIDESENKAILSKYEKDVDLFALFEKITDGSPNKFLELCSVETLENFYKFHTGNKRN